MVGFWGVSYQLAWRGWDVGWFTSWLGWFRIGRLGWFRVGWFISLDGLGFRVGWFISLQLVHGKEQVMQDREGSAGRV